MGGLPLLPAFRVVHVSRASRAVLRDVHTSKRTFVPSVETAEAGNAECKKEMQKTQEEFNL